MAKGTTDNRFDAAPDRHLPSQVAVRFETKVFSKINAESRERGISFAALVRELVADGYRYRKSGA